jgi:hypothetical protein
VRELPDREFASISAFCEQFVVTLGNEHSDAIRQVVKSEEVHFELREYIKQEWS